MRVLLTPVLLSVFAASLFAQARPEFEVASVKPSAPTGENVNLGMKMDGAQVHIQSLPLKEYIRIAYNLKDYQVIGPEWINSERFDVDAKVPEGGSDHIREMLQSLLADRFQLKTHDEQKEFPVYALVQSKSGIKIKALPPDPNDPPGARGPVNIKASGGRGGVYVDLGHGAFFSFANNAIEVKKITMVALADVLTRFVDRPIVDMTSLDGNYDFKLEFTPEDYQAMLIRSAVNSGVTLPAQTLRLLEGTSGDSTFAALETVGLKLDPRKAPLPVLVVDSISKTPGSN